MRRKMCHPADAAYDFSEDHVPMRFVLVDSGGDTGLWDGGPPPGREIVNARFGLWGRG